ncbi:MAG TPA: tetratricopeptide repeat protein [Thermoanaerobaculia bacterium]|jgi:Flp pilus assembly protein TadD|nr:tetratricopeptide repeat protein [Thermoanaerobaculia bacterium]
MKNALALLLFSLLATPLQADQAPPTAAQPAQPAAPQPAAPQPPLDKRVQEAIDLAEKGNAAGALQKLQALPKELVTPQVQSLIGALYLQVDKPQEALTALQPLADAADAEPAVLYNAGRAALLLNRMEEGRTYLTRSVLLQPASPAARDLGFLNAREGRVVEAYSMLRPWVLHNPKDADARVMAASLAVQLERPDDAAQLIAGLPENDPALRLLRGRILVLKKDGLGAISLLKPLLANHPQGMDIEVRRALAEAEMLAGHPAEAVQLLEGRAGSYPRLVLLLGRAQRQAGNAAAAMATLKPLADQLPEDPSVLGDPRPAVGIAMEYASLLVDAQRAQEAVPYLEKATRYHPRNPDVWKGLARALDAAGRKEEARKALAQAEEAAKPPVKPAAPPPAPEPAAAAPAAEAPPSEGLQKAVALMSQGQLEPALGAVRQEIGISKDPRARMLEVRLLLALRRPDDALKAAEEALQTDPNNPDFLYQRGAVEMSLQRLASAERDLRKTLQLAPRHTAAMNDLAVLLLNLHKKDEARSLLEQVLKINPQDKMAATNLERLRAEQ